MCWSHHCFCVSHQHYSLVLPPQFSSPRGGWEAADGLFECLGSYGAVGWCLKEREQGFLRDCDLLRSPCFERSLPEFVTAKFPFFTPFLHSLCTAWIPHVSSNSPSRIWFDSPSLHFCSTHTRTFSSQCCLLTLLCHLGDFRVIRRGEHDKAVTGAAMQAFVQSC